MVNLSTHMGSLSDFEKVFDTEDQAEKYLFDIKWADGFICPKCKHTKGWTPDNKPNSIKCSKCKNIHTVKSNSFIGSSKIPTRDWLRYIFMYAKTRGRFKVSNIGEIDNWVNSYIVDAKLRDLFSRVSNDFGDMEFVFREACRQLYLITHRKSLYNKTKFLFTNIIDPLEIIDFNDKNTLERIRLFITKTMFHCIENRWVFYKFCSTDDVLSELFLYLAESDEIGVITGDVLMDVSRKTYRKMWDRHIKDTPNLSAWIREYQKNKKTIYKRNLGRCYLRELITNSKQHLAFKNIQEMIKQEEFIEMYRKALIEKRQKRGYVSGIEFDLQASHPTLISKRGKVDRVNNFE